MEGSVNPSIYNNRIIIGWWIRYILSECFPKNDSIFVNKLFERSGILNSLFPWGYIKFPEKIPIKVTPNHGNNGK